MVYGKGTHNTYGIGTRVISILLCLVMLLSMAGFTLRSPEDEGGAGDGEPITEQTPEPTTEPEPTAEPTVEPESTPEPTAEPAATPEPTVEPTATPEPTAKPAATPESTAVPAPTARPVIPVPTAIPTKAPAETAEPEETKAPEPTAKPEETGEPKEEFHSRAEEKYGAGAMYLDEFLARNPGAKVYGLNLNSGIMPLAFESATSNVDPRWFKAAIGASTWSMNPNAASNLWSDSDYTVTDNNWAGPTSSTESRFWWNDLGFLPATADLRAGETGYPIITNKASNIQYAPSSAEAYGDLIYRWGNADVDGVTHLWLSSSRTGTESVIVLPDTTPTEVITLHYTPLEFKINYEIYVDNSTAIAKDDFPNFLPLTDAMVSDLWTTGGDASKGPWTADLTTVSQALDAVFGAGRPLTTTNQSADFSVAIPKGNYADVFADANLLVCQSANADGTLYDAAGKKWKLGEDLSWNTGSNPMTVNTGGGPGYFTLTGRYGTGTVRDDVTIKVYITTRNQEPSDYFHQEPGVVKKSTNTSDRVNNYKAETRGVYSDGIRDYTATSGYGWNFTFQVNPDGRNTKFLYSLRVNGEAVGVPTRDYGDLSITRRTGTKYFTITDTPAVTTVLSTGEIVTVELYQISRKYHAGSVTFPGTYYYRVTIENAYRNLVITNENTDNINAGSGNREEGPSVSVVYRDTDSKNVNVWLWYNGKWNIFDLAGSTIVNKPRNGTSFRYGYGTTVAGLTGAGYYNVRASLPVGYAFTGSNQKDEPNATQYVYARDITDDPTTGEWIRYGLEKAADGYYYASLDNSKDFNGDSRNRKAGTQTLISMAAAAPLTYNVVYMGSKNSGNYLSYTAANGNSDIVLKAGESVTISGVPTDNLVYNNIENIGRFTVKNDIPELDSNRSVYEFRYWVLTDMYGTPVTIDGKIATSSNDWVTFHPYETHMISELVEYTRNCENSGYQLNSLNHTIYLTAAFKQSEQEPYIHYLTFNTDGVIDGNVASDMSYTGAAVTQKTDFAGGDTIDFTDTKGHTTGVRRVMPASVAVDDMVDILVDKDEVTSIAGAVNPWYTFDEERANSNGAADYYNDYYWPNSGKEEVLELWFRDSRGGLTFNNIIDGYNIPLKYRITFQLPKYETDEAARTYDDYGNIISLDPYDYRFTVYDESEFFHDTASFKPTVTNGTALTLNTRLSKTDKGLYVYEVELKDGGSVTFPVLPQNVEYTIELVYEENGQTTDAIGYTVDEDRTETRVETRWEVRKGAAPTYTTTDDNGRTMLEKITGTVHAYDNQIIDLTLVGSYVIRLIQTAHPGNTTQEVGDYLGINSESHLNYTVEVTSYRKDATNVDVVLRVKTDATNQGDILTLVGGADAAIDHLGNATGAYSSDDHTITWSGVNIQPGPNGKLQATIRAQVPQVKGFVQYTAQAALTHDQQIEPEEILSNEVIATVFSNWLRIAKIVNGGDENDANERFEFTITLNEPAAYNEGESWPDNNTFPFTFYPTADAWNKGVPGTYTDRSGSVQDTLTFTQQPNGSYTATVYLASENRIVLYDLLEGTGYTVKETMTPAQEEKYTKVVMYGNTGTIMPDTADLVRVINTPVQTLNITKTVVGDATDKAEPFTFDVSLTLPQDIRWANYDDPDNVQGGHTFTVNGQSIQFTEEASEPDENGTSIYTYTGQITLSDGQTASLTGIPINTTYTVKETNGEDYLTAVTTTETGDEAGEPKSAYYDAEDGVTGTVKNDIDTTVAFTNYATRALTVSKTVSGEAMDPTAPFKFTVALTTDNELLKTLGLPVSFDVGYSEVSGASDVQPLPGNNTLAQTNNQLTFTLSHGQAIEISGLPYGVGYTVTEADYAYSGYYETTVSKSGGTAEKTNTASGTLEAAAAVAFNNDRLVNNVTIEKHVSSPFDADKNKFFTFQVTIDLGDMTIPAEGASYTYTGSTNGGPSGVITGKTNPLTATVQLSDGQSLTIKDLPTGATVTAVETLPEGSLFTGAAEGGTVTTDEDGVTTVEKSVEVAQGSEDNPDGYTISVTNTRKGNDLVIYKLVPEYIAGYDLQEFTFTVKLDDETNNNTYGEGADAVTFENGVTTVTVKVAPAENSELEGYATGAFTIPALPAGVAYTVTEKTDGEVEDLYEAPVWSLDDDSDTDTGTIGDGVEDASDDNYVICVNNKLTKLIVTKTVGGSTGSQKDQFTFTVTLSDTSITGTYGDAIFKNGVATVKLAHGESATIVGLPSGVTYTIEEADDGGYTTAVETTVPGDTASAADAEDTEDSGGQPADVKTATGVITGGVTTVAFTNTRDGNVPSNATMEYRWLIPAMLMACAGIGAILCRKRRTGRPS